MARVPPPTILVSPRLCFLGPVRFLCRFPNSETPFLQRRFSQSFLPLKFELFLPPLKLIRPSSFWNSSWKNKDKLPFPAGGCVGCISFRFPHNTPPIPELHQPWSYGPPPSGCFGFAPCACYDYKQTLPRGEVSRAFCGWWTRGLRCDFSASLPIIPLHRVSAPQRLRV